MSNRKEWDASAGKPDWSKPPKITTKTAPGKDVSPKPPPEPKGGK